MDQIQPSPVSPAASPPPQVVHVAARPGGLMAALGFGLGLFLLGIAFVTGLGIGGFTVFAGSMVEAPVLTEMYRQGGRGKSGSDGDHQECIGSAAA